MNMNPKSLPHPGLSFITKKPYDDNYAKTLALIEAINLKAKSDNDLALALDPDEACIYFGNRLSCQCNIDGVTNIFQYHLGNYYEAVLNALRRLDAEAMIAVLEGIRKAVMGDHKITPASIHEHAYEKYPLPPYENDVPPWEVELEKIADQAADQDFHERLDRFILAHFEEHGYQLEPYVESKA